METGKYDLSTAGSDGERRGCRWQYQYYHSCMDRDNLYESSDGIYFCETRTLFL